MSNQITISYELFKKLSSNSNTIPDFSDMNSNDSDVTKSDFDELRSIVIGLIERIEKLQDTQSTILEQLGEMRGAESDEINYSEALAGTIELRTGKQSLEDLVKKDDIDIEINLEDPVVVRNYQSIIMGGDLEKEEDQDDGLLDYTSKFAEFEKRLSPTPKS